MLNRANGRLPIFQKDGDYAAFERILGEALEHVPGMRLLAYCVLPNHWHLVVWPRHDGELSDFGHWLTLTHTQRWHARYHDAGMGHLYQRRFQSFPVARDDHFLRLYRYVERNALRAKLVGVPRPGAGGGSLWQRQQEPRPEKWILSDWPLAMPANWVEEVNRGQTEAWRPCVAVCSGGSPTAPRLGPSASRCAWVWKARCGLGAGRGSMERW
jgi:putative transposase